jgi:thioredoxin-dependent peroxiredoxin
MARNLAVGDEAPDFELADQTGQRHHLATLVQRGPVVLFFYPKDDTSLCTKECRAFRDNQPAFVAAGAAIFGISSDDLESHSRFAESHSLDYPLLSDPGGNVGELYGVRKALGVFPGRATFVVDRQRIVRFVLSARLQAERHTLEALAAVQRLASAVGQTATQL